MATSFDRWEKDPFFAAAEEVQESSDRMESVYRSWIQERNNGSDQNSDLGLSDLPRELHTALGTAKWQLEELERAVNSNDEAYTAGEDTRTRHTQFISAIKSRISMVENSLKESNVQRGENQLSWVRLDQEERDELALFLSCPSKTEKPFPKDTVIDFPDSSESTSSESKDLKKKKNKHRRALSADKDIGSWKINIPSEGEDTSERSSEERERTNMPLPKILSFSGLNGALEVKPRVKWYKNVARKGQNGHREDLEACLPLKNVQLNQEIEEACYERKGCLSTCGDENCEKQINGWIGAFQRQIQRSQYQIQYGRPIQIVIMVVFALLLICKFSFFYLVFFSRRLSFYCFLFFHMQLCSCGVRAGDYLYIILGLISSRTFYKVYNSKLTHGKKHLEAILRENTFSELNENYFAEQETVN